jgi:colanic acid/amylovoran biosynthesis glycosyltransferase
MIRLPASSNSVSPTVYVVGVNPRDLESSFIRAHIERLPASTVVIHGFVPTIGTRPVLSDGRVARLVRKLQRISRRQPWSEEITNGYIAAFTARPAVVLAEYGPTGVRLIDACRRTGLPLVVHFHGYDSSVRAVLEEHRESYPRLFDAAAAIIAVSRSMRATLIDLGAPAAKVHYCPYGVDCDEFRPGSPATAPPVAVAVGRFVEKKAPQLTILAFAKARQSNPAATLRMIGDGPLLGACLDMVKALHLEHAVTFLGQQPHDVVRAEMRAARCFVQHSVQAPNGDSEGTPNAVLEAGASGLPSVVTRHAGLIDVVRDGETGFLVNERDVDGMAASLSRMFTDVALVERMGASARDHIVREFAIENRLRALWSVIEDASGAPATRAATASVNWPAAAHGL